MYIPGILRNLLGNPDNDGFDAKILSHSSADEIFEDVKNTSQGLQQEDVLIFFFTGHGVCDKKLNGYLCVENTEAKSEEKIIYSTALSHLRLFEALSYGCGARVIVLDCCEAKRAHIAFSEFIAQKQLKNYQQWLLITPFHYYVPSIIYEKLEYHIGILSVLLIQALLQSKKIAGYTNWREVKKFFDQSYEITLTENINGPNPTLNRLYKPPLDPKIQLDEVSNKKIRSIPVFLLNLFKDIHQSLPILTEIAEAFEISNWLVRKKILPSNVSFPLIGRDKDLEFIFQKIKKGERFIVVRGNGGVGKSSVLKKIAEMIHSTGFTIGVPNIWEYEPLAEFCEASDEKICLFANYGPSPKGGFILDSEVRTIIKLMQNHGNIGFIVECRTEIYHQFYQGFKDLIDPLTDIGEFLINAIENPYDLPPLPIKEIVTQIWPNRFSDSQINEISHLSEMQPGLGNPLIAILASDWLMKGNSLENLTQFRFLQEYVDSVFFSKEKRWVKFAFELISAISVICSKDLKQITMSKFNISADLWKVAKTSFNSNTSLTLQRLTAHLNHECRNFFAIYPDIISETIFVTHGLNHQPPLSDLSELSLFPLYLHYYSQNLALNFQKHARDSSTTSIKIRKKISVIANNLLPYFYTNKMITNSMYSVYAATLLFNGIPIELRNFDFDKILHEEGTGIIMQHISEKITEATGLEVKVEKFDVIARFIAHLIQNLVSETPILYKEIILEVPKLEKICCQHLGKLSDLQIQVFMENIYTHLFVSLFSVINPSIRDQCAELIERLYWSINMRYQLKEERPLPELINDFYAEAGFMLISNGNLVSQEELLMYLKNRIIFLTKTNRLWGQSGLQPDPSQPTSNFFGALLGKIASHWKSAQRGSWFSILEKFFLSALFELDNSVALGLSLSNLYSKVLADLIWWDCLELFRDWSLFILDTFTKKKQDFKDNLSVPIQYHLFSNTVYHISQVGPPSKIEKAISILEEEIFHTTIESEKILIPITDIFEIYALCIASIASIYYPEEKQEWISYIENQVQSLPARYQQFKSLERNWLQSRFQLTIICLLFRTRFHLERNHLLVKWLTWIFENKSGVFQTVVTSPDLVREFKKDFFVKWNIFYLYYLRLANYLHPNGVDNEKISHLFENLVQIEQLDKELFEQVVWETYEGILGDILIPKLISEMWLVRFRDILIRMGKLKYFHNPT